VREIAKAKSSGRLAKTFHKSNHLINILTRTSDVQADEHRSRWSKRGLY
jgi:hypothetical protein